MTYSNKFVMSVLLNGQPQKELANGVVKLPFGTEYSLRFRNKNNRRAVVHILIDGEDVSGNGYIVPANSHVDIKRHHDVDRSFKFVSLDSADAVDFGKNGPNEDKVKGTIEARFYLEKEHPQCVSTSVEHHHHHHYPLPRPVPYYPPVYPIRPYQPIWRNDQSVHKTTYDNGNRPKHLQRRDRRIVSGQNAGLLSSNTQSVISNDEMTPLNTCSFNTSDVSASNNTGQQFVSKHIEVEDNYTTLKLFLQGHEGQIEEVPTSAVFKDRPTNKDVRLSELEAENESLRKKLAEIENAELKEKLAKASKKPRLRKKTTKKTK
jgi:hypothetical protein